MTIDDVIYCLKAGSEIYSELCEECNLYGQVGCDHCYNDANDMAIKALEELKEARKSFNENRKVGYKHGYSYGYNKAIDDFAEALKQDVMAKTFGLRNCDVDRIAEQLKAGGTDG